MDDPFQLSGAYFPDELASIAIGPWAPTEVDFDPDAPPRWCVSLDADAGQALAALERGEASLTRTEAALDGLPGRLDHAFAVAAGNVPFDEPVPATEAELVDVMTAFDASAVGPRDVVPLDQARGRKRWLELAARARSGMEAVLRLITHAAWVETEITGEVVASTAMRWSGDTRTELSPSLSVATARMHTRSVIIAVRTRGAWSRLIALVLSMSVQIARAWSSPAGLVSALPAAWNFARGVLTEVDTLRELGASGR